MTTVVFDLGGVVVVWDPVPAVAAAVGQERAEHFVHGGEFDFAAWNHAQDAGRSWADAEAAATDTHPGLAEEIAAYRANFALTLTDLVPGTAQILRALHDRGVRLVALTNWSAETIRHGPEAFPDVFSLFDDIVVSRVEGVAKPDREIFGVLAARLGHPVGGVFYVDDSVRNVDAARSVGMDAVHFTDAATLREELRVRGLLDGGDVRPSRTGPEDLRRRPGHPMAPPSTRRGTRWASPCPPVACASPVGPGRARLQRAGPPPAGRLLPGRQSAEGPRRRRWA